MPVTDTRRLPLLPLDRGVVVPGMVVNVMLAGEELQAAVAAAEGAGGQVALVPRFEGRYATVGVVAVVEQVEAIADTSVALLRATSRARLGGGAVGRDSLLWVDVEVVEPDDQPRPEAVALADRYRAVVSEILELRRAPGVVERLRSIRDPGELADTAVFSPDLSVERKLELLETLDVEERLAKATDWMQEVLAGLRLRSELREQTGERMDRQQREYLLRQQMDAIREELGETDEGDADEFRARLDGLDAPEAVRDQIAREIDRLERTNEQSPEHGWIRTWLETMFDVPWGRRSDDRLDLTAARDVLDADHTGLDEVKERLLEHLAVRKLRRERGLDAATTADAAGRGGAILLLVGPPGVGKTSLGASVARAMERRFVRVALGGVRDEAEIRGHRRTYVGARPGRIVRALTDAGTMNPVLLLDEVDKVGADWRGDPSSALLEVLDPAQNHTFRDHYLEVDLDLSGVVFLATANVAETIPGPLLDRMEVLRLDGYTDVEKRTIARDHLWPRQLERAGLRHDEVVLTDEVLAAVIDRWTRESGVRNLERRLGGLARKAAARIAADPGAVPVTPTVEGLRDLLGRALSAREEAAGRTRTPGVAIGLAVTGAGGDVLFVEAAVDAGGVRGSGDDGLTLTGQLGEVMQESATIARSYVRAHAAELGVDPATAARRTHLHVPAGAVPKDGPSAGVTMVTALVSALSRRRVREVGMTGEVTLQGRVLPIGGVRQKVLAAHRAGLREVVLPAGNAEDVGDVPVAVREEMTIHLAGDVREVLDLALEPSSGTVG